MANPCQTWHVKMKCLLIICAWNSSYFIWKYLDATKLKSLGFLILPNMLNVNLIIFFLVKIWNNLCKVTVKLSRILCLSHIPFHKLPILFMFQTSFTTRCPENDEQPETKLGCKNHDKTTCAWKNHRKRQKDFGYSERQFQCHK